MASRKEQQIHDFLSPLTQDIFKFCEAMRFSPTENQQVPLFEEVQKGTRQIAVKSGQGPGKTAAMGIAGMWRLLREHKSKLVVTAPTMRQCKDVWLQEARILLGRADPALQRFINITKTKIIIAGDDDWCAEMVTATREENAQGYHRENMTIICEEASGLSKGIITQFKGTLSNPGAMMIQIGNPTKRDSPFFECFNRDRHNWKCFTFNSEETPESAWFSCERNRLLEEEFGRDSDVYRVRVLGQFPHTDPNCVVSSELVEQCTALPLLSLHRTASAVKQFGIDFARFGGDENVVFRREGNSIVEWSKHAHTDPSDVVDLAFKQQMMAGWSDADCTYVADAGGMGQGIMHRFHDAGKKIDEYHNNARASSLDYGNRITESWFGLARMIREGMVYLPNDSQLIQQLGGRQYFVNKKGKIVLESKDEYIRRGNEHSPDRADACVLAFDERGMVTGSVASRPRRNRSRGTRRLGI